MTPQSKQERGDAPAVAPSGFLGTALSEEHASAVNHLLSALAADMQALRKMDVTSAEPASTYATVEGQP